MNHNEPIYELSANWDWAHEAFFNQHFVGKRLTYNPHAPLYHITFADGTAVYVTDTNRDGSYDVNMRDHQNTGTIEPLIREVDAPGSDEPPYMTEAEHYANDCRYDDGDEEPTLAQLGL